MIKYRIVCEAKDFDYEPNETYGKTFDTREEAERELYKSYCWVEEVDMENYEPIAHRDNTPKTKEEAMWEDGHLDTKGDY